MSDLVDAYTLFCVILVSAILLVTFVVLAMVAVGISWEWFVMQCARSMHREQYKTLSELKEQVRKEIEIERNREEVSRPSSAD